MARPKLGDGETHRLHMKIGDEELAIIDDWRFENRVQSRSEAIRRLCQIGAVASAEIAAMRGAAERLSSGELKLGEEINAALSPEGIDYDLVGRIVLGEGRDDRFIAVSDLYLAVERLAVQIGELQQAGKFEDRRAEAARMLEAAQRKAQQLSEQFPEFQSDKGASK